jgi:hypothetical protein
MSDDEVRKGMDRLAQRMRSERRGGQYFNTREPLAAKDWRENRSLIVGLVVFVVVVTTAIILLFAGG